MIAITDDAEDITASHDFFNSITGMFNSGSSDSSERVKEIVAEYLDGKFKPLSDLEKEVWTLCYHEHEGNCLNFTRLGELRDEYPMLVKQARDEIKGSSVEFLEAKWKSIKEK